MTALSAADRGKLAKLLGMLGSDHAGERDAAGLAARRFLLDRKLTWAQVLEPPAIEKQMPQMGIWRDTVARCLAQPGALRPWERGFLTDLPGFRRLSAKQRYILNEIATRVLGSGQQ